MDSSPNVPEIRTRGQLIELAGELGVGNWHEPDQVNVTARWGGTELHLDNAMGVRWFGGPPFGPPRAEMYVILCREVVEEGIARRGPDIATINLANLMAWASEPHERPAEVGDYIGPRGPIPANVVEVEDSLLDTWRRTTPAEDAEDQADHGQRFGWATGSSGSGRSTEEGLLDAPPLKVTKIAGPVTRRFTGPGELERSGYIN